MTYIDSTSDDRTRNNTFRQQYRILTEEEKARMNSVKELSQNLLDLIHSLGSSRELEIASVRLEEACMWAVKHLTK